MDVRVMKVKVRTLAIAISAVVLVTSHLSAALAATPSFEAMRAFDRSARSQPARKSSRASTDFAGGWHGRLLLKSASCYGFARSFPFRHLISMSGNRANIQTSHDGTLSGISRDKGRRLETTRRYLKNGQIREVAVVYADNNTSWASMGFAVRITANGRVCRASYGGNAIRAF